MPTKLRQSHKKLPQSDPIPELDPVEDKLESGQGNVATDVKEKAENETMHDLSVSGHSDSAAGREEKFDTTIIHDLSISTGNSRKTITIGEFEFSLPEEKFPLLGVMGCAIILFISIFIDENIYASSYKYGLFLPIFAFVGALISVAIPTKKTIPLNYIIYFLTYSGAILATMDFGPFNKPGNGYFASWGLVISSAIAADPPGCIKRCHFNTMLNVAAAALVFIVASLPQFIDGSEYRIEVYCAVSVAGILFLMATILLILSCSTIKTDAIACVTSIAFTIAATAWLIIAGVVTFKGPFTETGTGYFSAWFTVVMSVKATILEWRKLMLKRRDEGK